MTTALTSSNIASGTWTLDGVHSLIGFQVRHFGIAWVRGGFNEIDATFTASEDDGFTLTGTAPVESISFPNEQLHGHLMGPDFFDAELHPTLTFTSTSVQLDEDGTAHVAGELTMRGNTRPVELTGSWSGPVQGMGGEDRIGLELSGTVDRLDFGISWAAKLAGGHDVVSPKVKVDAQLELVRQ